MKYNFNNKEINIPDDEVQKLMETLELTEQEAIDTWLDDNDYTTNEEVERLTKKAKENKADKIVVRSKAENKKTTRERKPNETKALIIAEIYQKLAEIEGISNIKVENKEKLITFSLNNNNYKIDLIQKRAEKPKK